MDSIAKDLSSALFYPSLWYRRASIASARVCGKQSLRFADLKVERHFYDLPCRRQREKERFDE
jgi:hypothetical protein